MSTSFDTLQHEEFCQPRPGEDNRRIDRYTLPQYDADGVTLVNHVGCVRCIECGVIAYDGVQPGV